MTLLTIVAPRPGTDSDSAIPKRSGATTAGGGGAGTPGSGAAAIGGAPECARSCSPQLRCRRRMPRKVSTSSIADSHRQRPSVSYTIDRVVAPLELRHAYDDIVAEAARLYNLDPHMIRAVMQAESSFDATAVSPVGALGLMQLMPAVAAELGATDPLDPAAEHHGRLALPAAAAGCASRQRPARARQLQRRPRQRREVRQASRRSKRRRTT